VGGIEGLPPLIKDQELVLRDGEKEQVIVDGSQVELDPASRQLEIIWRRQRPPITQLLQNYPNPFNPESWIPFDLAAEAVVKIEIYSQKGILVRRLFLGYTDAGIYRQKERAAYWDGRNAMGEPVSSGIYFYQIQADDYRQMRKMVILK
ncbi:MAG: FlgD immunoglobulin-like domain containing protein, partial [Candidatus Poribacteria bacterium]|nr:FlgD immunoglobulin-like domain containing protein [Candidatus Poribacteria bacterium]